MAERNNQGRYRQRGGAAPARPPNLRRQPPRNPPNLNTHPSHNRNPRRPTNSHSSDPRRTHPNPATLPLSRRQPPPQQTLTQDELDQLLTWLPLPPDPTNQHWRNRCFRCFAHGHRTQNCQGTVVCLYCCKLGHPSRACPDRDPSDDATGEALVPRGVPGYVQPHGERPSNAFCHINIHPVLRQESQEYLQAYVVDAFHIPKHCVQSVSLDINNALKWSKRFKLTHMAGTKYLLRFLPPDHHFQLPTLAQAILRDDGYMPYRWSPLVGGKQFSYEYKIWVDIHHLPPHLWSLDEIAKGIGPYGLLIDHASLYNVHSYERYRILVASNTVALPKNITFVVDGVQYEAPISICSWIKEPTTFNIPPDTSPDNEVFVSVGLHMLDKEKISNYRNRNRHSSSSSDSFQPASPFRPASSPPSLTNLLPKVPCVLDRDLLLDLCNISRPSELKGYMQSILLNQGIIELGESSGVQQATSQPQPPLSSGGADHVTIGDIAVPLDSSIPLKSSTRCCTLSSEATHPSEPQTQAPLSQGHHRPSADPPAPPLDSAKEPTSHHSLSISHGPGPCSAVGPRSTVRAGSALHPGSSVGPGSTLGPASTVAPNSVCPGPLSQASAPSRIPPPASDPSSYKPSLPASTQRSASTSSPSPILIDYFPIFASSAAAPIENSAAPPLMLAPAHPPTIPPIAPSEPPATFSKQPSPPPSTSPSSDKRPRHKRRGKAVLPVLPLRRSNRKAKKVDAFPGLIPTPITRRGKKKILPRSIKEALAAANLTEILEQEALLSNPLNTPLAEQVQGFCLASHNPPLLLWTCQHLLPLHLLS